VTTFRLPTRYGPEGLGGCYAPETLMQPLLELEAAKGLATVQWPEGGRLSPPRTLGMDAMSLTVKRNGSWFDADGELKLDQGQVASLQEVLAATEQNSSRFVKLGDGRVYALAETFRRRLDDLRALGETRDGGVRLVAQTSGLFVRWLDVSHLDLRNRMICPRSQAHGRRAPCPALPYGFRGPLRATRRSGGRGRILPRRAGRGFGSHERGIPSSAQERQIGAQPGH